MQENRRKYALPKDDCPCVSCQNIDPSGHEAPMKAFYNWFGQ